MSKSHIPRVLRQQVIAAALGRCAYCHTVVEITGARFVIDHIIPEVVGGETTFENLCLACHACNEFKGAQFTAIDPTTEDIVTLFHPRHHRWRDHFRWSSDSSHIIGLTATGRATVVALNMNHPDIVRARRRWSSVGWHPPQADLL